MNLLPDAKPEHQYVISFFELSYNEWTLIARMNVYLILLEYKKAYNSSKYVKKEGDMLGFGEL